MPEHQNGDILGYYIGYKEKDSQSRFIYITKSIDGEFLPEVDIHNLEKFTEYTVHVQAYNQMGRGPPSPDAQVFTLEDGKITDRLLILWNHCWSWGINAQKYYGSPYIQTNIFKVKELS